MRELDWAFPDDPDSLRAFLRLVRRLQQGGVNALVGAGAVVSCGFPTWEQLLEELGSNVIPAHMQKMLNDLKDPLWRAEEYREHLGPRYFSLIENRFGPQPKPISQIVQDIVALNVRHIFTTNYDLSLEQAYRQLYPHDPLYLEWSDPKAVRSFLETLYEPYGSADMYMKKCRRPRRE